MTAVNSGSLFGLDVIELLALASQGDRRALAKLISAAERGNPVPGIPLDNATSSEQFCIGVTGAPGAGKSTLVSALVDELIKTEHSAAVLAVDPSSPISQGALLGDRIRMQSLATAPNVFIRSMATRNHKGGLALATQTARRLLQYCGWPLVLIETVGIGQVELDVVKTADIALVVLTPESGDEIQANKAGLMEIGDIFVINKADRPGADSLRRDIDSMLSRRTTAFRPLVIETVASKRIGLEQLVDGIGIARRQLMESGAVQGRRRAQLAAELEQQIARDLMEALERFSDGQAFSELLSLVASGEQSVSSAAASASRQLLITRE